MPFLLDTNICSAALKRQPEIHTRLIQYGGQLHLSRLTCAELYALGYRKNAKRINEIDDFIDELNVVEFDEDCAREYGRIHAALAARGLSAGRADLMIAATALVHGFILVTHDSDFLTLVGALPQLRLADWL
jgi:tRNA(fMet)-specific endonuclease VapC